MRHRVPSTSFPPAPSPSPVNKPLLIAYIGLAIAGALLFWRGGNGPLKRAVFPPYMLVMGAVFYFLATSSWKGQGPWFFPIIIGVITIFNIRQTQFCAACGAMVRSRTPFSRPTTCTKCGHPLHLGAPTASTRR